MTIKILFVLLIIILMVLLKIKQKIIRENFISYNDIRNEFGNIYIINMDKDKDRMKELDLEMKQNNLKYIRIPAVDGSKLTENSFLVKKYFGKPKIKYSNGQKGCTLSHIGIWNKIKKNNSKYNIVLEDDVIIPKKLFKKLNIYLKQLPKDWDFLFLGGNRITGKKYKNNLVKPDINVKWGNYGTFAYLLNSRNIDKILNKCKNIVLHTDTFIQKELGKELKIFFCNPQLIEHNYDNHSNIFKRNRKNDALRNNKIILL